MRFIRDDSIKSFSWARIGCTPWRRIAHFYANRLAFGVNETIDGVLEPSVRIPLC